jgi:hypothetical protein
VAISFIDGGNDKPTIRHWQTLSLKVLSSITSPLAEFESVTLLVIYADCTTSYTFNYHRITTTCCSSFKICIVLAICKTMGVLSDTRTAHHSWTARFIPAFLVPPLLLSLSLSVMCLFLLFVFFLCRVPNDVCVFELSVPDYQYRFL